MKSEIVRHLQPEFAPVAVIWSDAIPANAFEFKTGRLGCALYLFAKEFRTMSPRPGFKLGPKGV